MTTDQIIQRGDLQPANQFEVFFPNGIPGVSDTDGISLQIEDTFPMPEESVGVFERNYRGMKIPYTIQLDETSKELQFTVLVEQNMEAYNGIMDYFDSIYNRQNGTKASEIATRITIGVRAIGSDGNISQTWLYTGAKLKSVKFSDFQHSASEPAKIDLGWIFVNFKREN